jgi:hypothetical protein
MSGKAALRTMRVADGFGPAGVDCAAATVETAANATAVKAKDESVRMSATFDQTMLGGPWSARRPGQPPVTISAYDA